MENKYLKKAVSNLVECYNVKITNQLRKYVKNLYIAQWTFVQKGALVVSNKQIRYKFKPI